MAKTPSTDIGIKRAYTAKYGSGQDVTFLLDAVGTMWLFGRQVCPIINYKNPYNAVTRHCPHYRKIKRGHLDGFALPIDIPNAGTIIFPLDDLNGLLAAAGAPIEPWTRPINEAKLIFKDFGSSTSATIELSQPAPQPEPELIEAQPEPELPEVAAPERWFEEVGTFEFEGMVFTGLLDVEEVDGRRWGGFIAQEITDHMEYERQHGSTRYLPQYSLGWFNKRTSGGLRKVRAVDERGFYRLIMRAKQTPQAERFQAWVCDIVLPEIQRTGSYSAKPQLPDIRDPEVLEQIILQQIADRKEERAQHQRERYELLRKQYQDKDTIDAQQGKIDAQQGMLDYKNRRQREITNDLIQTKQENRKLKQIQRVYRVMEETDGSILLKQGAKLLDFPPKAFNDFLGDNHNPDKFIYKTDWKNRKGPWLPMEIPRRLNYVVYKEVPRWHDDAQDPQQPLEPQTRITVRGLTRFLEMWLQDPYYYDKDDNLKRLEMHKTPDKRDIEELRQFVSDLMSEYDNEEE
jgi:prophage antirepressor-like protein